MSYISLEVPPRQSAEQVSRVNCKQKYKESTFQMIEIKYIHQIDSGINEIN